jgi:adenosylhomocysteine nucleosidase
MSVIGIVTGLKLEAEILRHSGKSWGKPLPLITISGPGPRRAQEHAEKLIKDGVDALMSFGLAGGLAPDLSAGSIIVPQEIHQLGFAPILSDAAWCGGLKDCIDGQLNLREVNMVSLDSIIDSVDTKHELWVQTGAGAVDMESAAIAECAARAGVPFIAIRAISDPAHSPLPPVVKQAVNTDGTTRPFGVMKSLLRHPRQMSELVALAQNTKRAKTALGKLARLAGPGFGLV